MKTRHELQRIIDEIRSVDSPVGIDAVYVHALILDKLEQLESRIVRIERALGDTREDQRVVVR